MARSRNPNRDKAYEIFKNNDGEISPKKIAEMLNENTSNIRNWKKSDKWEYKLKEDTRPGAPKGNQNAKGKGAPKGNLNGVKTGEYLSPDRFMKGLPKITQKTIEESIQGYSYLEILWLNIQALSAKILVMQRITHVKNKKDITKELKKVSIGKVNSEEYEIQFAWDKENSSVTALSKAMDTLTKMIDKYDKILNANWDLATEEQKVRIEVLKSKITNTDSKKEDKMDKYFEALEDAINAE